MTLTTKVGIGVGIVAFVIVILFATGKLKFNITKVDETDSSSAPTTSESKSSSKKGSSQKAKLNSEAVSFVSKAGLGTFKIKIPVGWSLSDDPAVDFIAGSMVPTKISTGEDFYSNINIIIGPHEGTLQTFADYKANWKDAIKSQYPGVEFVADGSTKVNGMDTYVLEIIQPAPNGAPIHQIQYVYYIDQQIAAVATGTAADEAWDDFDQVVNDSLKSFQKTTDTSSI